MASHPTTAYVGPNSQPAIDDLTDEFKKHAIDIPSVSSIMTSDLPTAFIGSNFQSVFDAIDDLADGFIERLGRAIAIPSVSSDPELRPQVFAMANWLEQELKALGVEVKQRPLGPEPDTDPVVELPPVLLARYGNDQSKPTLLVYGHYDVQPAAVADGWRTNPFKLHTNPADAENPDAPMFGRGSTDDKGPIMGWLNAIEAYQTAKLDFPVNLLMCFEGMEESGSTGLEPLIHAEANAYFKDAHAVCISDNYWLGTTKPCLTYGLRGCSYYAIEFKGPGHDLHSGIAGGATREPMVDLVNVMSSLVDNNGRILIDHVYEQVAHVTEKEAARYETIKFSMSDLHNTIGSTEVAIHDKEIDALMARWRHPSLSIHGIHGAFSGAGAKTVIPACVTGKFSIRTVPDMIPDDLDKHVIDYVDRVIAGPKTTNKGRCYLIHGGMWWLADPDHWNFVAAAKATESAYGIKPDFTREGGSIPVTLTFQEALKKNVVLLPMGRGDDGAHSINEKLNRSNYIQGTKTMAAYVYYFAQEARQQKQ